MEATLTVSQSFCLLLLYFILMRGKSRILIHFIIRNFWILVMIISAMPVYEKCFVPLDATSRGHQNNITTLHFELLWAQSILCWVCNKFCSTIQLPNTPYINTKMSVTKRWITKMWVFYFSLSWNPILKPWFFVDWNKDIIKGKQVFFFFQTNLMRPETSHGKFCIYHPKLEETVALIKSKR